MNRPYVATLDIKPAYHKILFALYQYHLLTTDLVVHAVGSPGSATLVEKNIKTLAEKNYIFRFKLATTVGRSPFVCVLSEQGMKYFRDERELEINFYRHPSWWKSMSSSWLMHPLELNKLIVAGNMLTRTDLRIGLPMWEHDFLLKSTPFIATDKSGEVHRVIPDTILPFTVTMQPDEQPKRRILWVELERETHRKKAFLEKLRGIYWVIENGIFEERYNHPIPRICFISTSDDDHVAWMQMQARQLITDIRGHISFDDLRNRMFFFGRIPSLQGEDINSSYTFLEPTTSHPFGDKKFSLLGI